MTLIILLATNCSGCVRRRRWRIVQQWQCCVIVKHWHFVECYWSRCA